MSNLFIRHFSRILEQNLKVNLSSANPKQIRSSLANFRAKYDLKDYTILHRFPRKDMKTLISLPCPIQETTEKGKELGLVQPNQTISSMKNLRFAFDIREFKACSKCPLKETCVFKDQVPEGHKANVTDLLVAMIGFAEKDPIALKKLIETIEKPKTEGENTDQVTSEASITTHEGTSSNPDETKEQSVESQQKESNTNTSTEEQQIDPEFKFKYWNSGLKVLDTLSVVLDDLYNNNGLENRRFINIFLDELSKSKWKHINENKEKLLIKKTEENDEEESSSSSEKQQKKQKAPKKQKENDSESESESISDFPKKSFQKNKETFTKPDNFRRNDRFSDRSEGKRDKPYNTYNSKPSYSKYGARDEEKSFEGQNDRPTYRKYDRKNEDNSYNRSPRRSDSYGNNSSYQGDRKPRYNKDFNDAEGEGKGGYNNKRFSSNWDNNKNFNNKNSYSADRYEGKKRYQVDEDTNNKRSFNRKKPEEKFEGSFEAESEIKNEKFMRDSQKDYKKHNKYEDMGENSQTPRKFEDKTIRFRKRPQGEEFPVVEKDDMLMRGKKGGRFQKKDSNFSFSETEPNKKDE